MLFIGGNLLALVALLALMASSGSSLNDALLTLQQGMDGLPSNFIRSAVWIQTLTTFILPAIVYGLIYHGRSFGRYLGAQRFPSLPVIGLSVLIMAASYPLVQLAFELNRMIPVNDWMSTMEESAIGVMEQILQMDSALSLLTTLVIVGVLPAIGEELIFRGILQKELGQLFKSKHLGIWLAAILFSAIHLQFEGFLPRLVLGAVLGYLYHWTRTIWVPILIHFLNNGVQVMVLYYSGVDLSAEDIAAEPVPWWGIVLGTLVLITACHRLIQITSSHEQQL